MGGADPAAAPRRADALQRIAPRDRGHLAKNAVAGFEKPRARRADPPPRDRNGAGDGGIFDHAVRRDARRRRRSLARLGGTQSEGGANSATPLRRPAQGDRGVRMFGSAQYCPAFASSTSTRSSISDNTVSSPGSPEEDFRLAAASRSRLTVEASKLPDSSPILRSSSTSSAPLPRWTERLRRSTGSSSMPCMASSASMFAAALGATAARVSGADAASGSAKPVELVRRALAAGEPRLVPFGP